MPIADPEYHKDQDNYPNETVKEFAHLASKVNEFIFATPIYHNSYSGVLKNALDHLARVHFTDKPIGLISHGGNRTPQAIDHLRIVARGLNGVCIPTQVCTSSDDFKEMEIKNEKIIGRIDRFTDEMVKFCNLFEN